MVNVRPGRRSRSPRENLCHRVFVVEKVLVQPTMAAGTRHSRLCYSAHKPAARGVYVWELCFCFLIFPFLNCVAERLTISLQHTHRWLCRANRAPQMILSCSKKRMVPALSPPDSQLDSKGTSGMGRASTAPSARRQRGQSAIGYQWWDPPECDRGWIHGPRCWYGQYIYIQTAPTGRWLIATMPPTANSARRGAAIRTSPLPPGISAGLGGQMTPDHASISSLAARAVSRLVRLPTL